LLILLLQYSESFTQNFTIHIILSSQFSSRTFLKFKNILNNCTAKTTISKTKKTFLYNFNFKQNLIDNGIYSDKYKFPNSRNSLRSNNYNEIFERLKKSRLSLLLFQLFDKKFRIFKQINSRVLNKNAVIDDVFSVIQNTVCIFFAKNLAFANLELLTHDNFVDVKSDFYNEARSVQIDLRIRQELELYIVSIIQKQTPALLNFFIETKNFDKSATVIKRQACFDDVLKVRNIYRLRLFETNSRLVYDNNAYTIISIYYNEIFKLYTIYNIQVSDIEVSSEYYITQFNIFVITDTAERFREEITAFRNAKNWTKKQKDRIIVTANNSVIKSSRDTFNLKLSIYSMQSIIEPNTLESEISVDELFQNVNKVFSFLYKRLKRKLQKRVSKSDLKYRFKKSSSETNCRFRSRNRLLQKSLKTTRNWVQEKKKKRDSYSTSIFKAKSDGFTQYSNLQCAISESESNNRNSDGTQVCAQVFYVSSSRRCYRK